MTLTLAPEQQCRHTVYANPRPMCRLCLLASTLLLLPAAAPTQIFRAAKSPIQAQYRRLADALVRSDWDAYRRCHTADCLFLDPTGKSHTLDAFFAELTQAQGEGTHIQNVVTTIQRIRRQSSGYAAQVREHVTLTKIDDKGELGAKGQKHTLVLTFSGRDLWQNTDGAWLRHKAHMKTIDSLTIDGKRIPKPKPDAVKIPLR